MSTWQSMIRITDAQIKEIGADPSLLDTFLYTLGMRNRMEQLADLQEQGHVVIQTKTGIIVTSKDSITQTRGGLVVGSKDSGVQVMLPAVPWYRRLWDKVVSVFGNKPSQPYEFVKIERPPPPTIPSHWVPLEGGDRCNFEQNFDLIYHLFSDCAMPGAGPLNFMLGPWCRKEKYDIGEKGALYIASDKVDSIIAAVEAVPEETLRKRYDNKERLVSLGCGYATEFEGEEYDEFIGGVISDMKRFLHRVREKGDGILVLLS